MGDTVTVDFDRLQDREQSLRLTLARMLDAVERYPSDLGAACIAARAEMRRNPLWSELTDFETERSE